MGHEQSGLDGSPRRAQVGKEVTVNGIKSCRVVFLFRPSVHADHVAHRKGIGAVDDRVVLAVTEADLVAERFLPVEKDSPWVENSDPDAFTMTTVSLPYHPQRLQVRVEPLDNRQRGLEYVLGQVADRDVVG